MSEAILKIIKCVAAFALIPVVVGVAKSFHAEFMDIKHMYAAFRWGVATYLFVHLFIYVPQGLYNFGQKVFNDIFRFVPVLGGTVGSMVPLYTTLSLIVLYLGTTLLNVRGLESTLMFLAGLTLTMHVILTAQELREEDAQVIKAHYFLMVIIAFIVNILLVAWLLDINYTKFAFPHFFKEAVAQSKLIYRDVFDVIR